MLFPRLLLCLFAGFLVLYAPPGALAQVVLPFECGGDGLSESERSSLTPIEDGPEVRALVVLIRFQDDDSGSDPWIPIDSPYRGWPYWLHDENGTPVLDGNGDPVPADFEMLPNFGHGLIAPSVSAITDSDSTISAYFYEQSKAGPNGEAQFLLWGDVLPTNGFSWDQGEPIVYVTQHDNEWYHNVSGTPNQRGYGYLTKEVLDHLVYEQGLDLGLYNLNPESDDVVDQIFMIVRSEELPHYLGISNLSSVAAGLSGRPPGSDNLWYPSPSGVLDPNLPDSVRVDWSASGNYIWNDSGGNVHQATFYGRWGAHEYGHDLWRDRITSVHMSPIENSVPANEPPGMNYYGSLLMGSSTSPSAYHFQSAHTISAYERSLLGWIALDTLTTTRYDITLGDLYTHGEAAVLPIGSGDTERVLFLSNLQRLSYFDSLKVGVGIQGDIYDREGLQMTGLLAHFRGRRDADDCSVDGLDTKPCVDMLPPDNALGTDYVDDVYKPGVKTQLTPWTKPNINGCNAGSEPYCQNLDLTWAAIDDIRYVANDPDSTMAFDYYADFRTASTVAIRNDSWMGDETSGTTFPNEVRVMDGATLTIEPGTELAFGGGLTVEDGAHVVFQPGSIVRFGEGVGFSIEGTADIQGTSASPVVFEGDGLFPYQRWGGIVIQGSNTSLSYVEVSEAGIGIEVRARNVSLDHLTLDGSSLVTDYAWCGDRCLRSSIELTNSTITGSEGDGLVLRNVDTFGDGIRDNTISDNDLHGVVVWNADVAPFELNVVEGNGIGFTYIPNVKYDGIAVLSNGSLHLSEASVFYGYNRIADNWDDELSVASGGYLFVGDTGSGYNTIEKTGKSSAASGSEKGAEAKSFAPDYPRHIETASTVYAQNTWWGSSSGPPSGAFGGSGTVYYAPFLTSEPPGVARPGDDSMLLAANGSKGEGGDLAWLREQILHVRGLLAEGPVAPGLVRRLYALQRIDAGDVLGEHEATMVLLADVRSLLDGEPEGATRRAAEAALGAEVSDALRQEDYDAAEALVTTYAAVVAETEEYDLALGVVAVDEQAGRYAEALQRIEAVIGSLGEDEAALARSLEGVAALIEAKLNGEGRGATPPQATAGAKSAAGLPAEYALEAAYPNPFSRSATLPVALPEAADVRLAVYDLLGREVAVVADERLEAGRHTLIFDGSRLASGVYVVRASLRGSGAAHVLTRRITLVK